MQLESISGSQLPNALALILAVIATILAHRRRVGPAWLFDMLCVALTLTVIAKNVAYGLIIADHAENSAAAHRDYAQALLVVAGVQMALSLCFLLAGLASKRLLAVTFAPVVACIYAAVSRYDWSQVYQTQDASQPVHYEVGAPWLHWVLLVCLALAIVVMIIAAIRRRPVAHRR